jgi:hypothetical protein
MVGHFVPAVVAVHKVIIQRKRKGTPLFVLMVPQVAHVCPPPPTNVNIVLLYAIITGELSFDKAYPIIYDYMETRDVN